MVQVCRIELSFDHKLDDAFQVDIKKSRILLDESLYDWMQKFLQEPCCEGQERYRKGMNAAVTGIAAPIHAASNNSIHAKAEDLKTADVKEVDGSTGDVTIANKNGVTKLKIKLVEQKNSGECHVQPADSLQDGVLGLGYIDAQRALQKRVDDPSLLIREHVLWALRKQTETGGVKFRFDD